MKIYLRDVFSGSSISSAKWTVAPTVTLESGEAVITKTTEPGDVLTAGSLTSKVVVPASVIIHWDSRFITNTLHQSGTGEWSGENVFFRKTNTDWNSGHCMQAMLSYHVQSDVVIEAFLNLYHRSPTGAALIGRCNIPLDLFESLDIETDGIVLRDLNIKAQGGTFTISVADVEIDVFTDPIPVQVSSPVQFGTGSTVNLTLKNSIDNVLITSV